MTSTTMTTEREINLELDPLPDGNDIEESLTLTSDDGASENGNRFQTRRTISQRMYDVALLMANVSQLKTVLNYESSKYYQLLLGLLITSISLHVISAIMLYILFIVEKYEDFQQRHRGQQRVEKDSNDNTSTVDTCMICSKQCCQCWRLYVTDCVATLCVFFVTLLNIGITAFIGNADFSQEMQTKTNTSSLRTNI